MPAPHKGVTAGHPALRCGTGSSGPAGQGRVAFCQFAHGHHLCSVLFLRIHCSKPKPKPGSQNRKNDYVGYDLPAAMARQGGFLRNVLRASYNELPFLQRALDRYIRFVLLWRDTPGLLVVPMYDIDLMWHAHMAHSGAYRADMKAIAGKVRLYTHMQCTVHGCYCISRHACMHANEPGRSQGTGCPLFPSHCAFVCVCACARVCAYMCVCVSLNRCLFTMTHSLARH